MRISRKDSTYTASPKGGLSVLKKAMVYAWPKDNLGLRIRVVFALLCLAVSKFMIALAPLAFGSSVDFLSPTESDPAYVLGLGAIGLVIAYGFARISGNGFQQLRTAVFAPVTSLALRQIAKETFEHIHALSMRYHISRKTGGLSRIMERGVKAITFLLEYLVFSIGPLFLELIIVLVIIGAKLGAIYIAILLVTFIAYIVFTLKVTEIRVRIRKEMNDKDTEANQKAVDSLLNFETVRYFGAQRRETDNYDVALAGYAKASIKTDISLAALNFGQALIISTGIIAAMVCAAVDVQKGTISVGDFVMVNAFMIQITMPLNFLGSMYRNIRQSLVDMEEMFDLLGQEIEIKDKDDARELSIKEGAIRFKDVNFGYETSRQILHGLNLSIPAQKKIAIVGSSGSGKSTIGRMLFRFYDVWQGQIEIDGQNIQDVTQESLHQAIGVVPQDTVLFNNTISYNIAYGKDNATMEEVVEVAKKARIHDFIMELPEGYETQVGERGLKLSGGEKQRVGIARTILKDPPILLLDEATSALDTQTEHDILSALEDAGRGRTVITIAHRLSTVVESDVIVVLEKGHVVEQGTHNDLLQKEGRYAKLWAKQSSENDGVPSQA